MRVIVVNEQDEIIGYKERNENDPNEIIRVAALWIFNTQGEVLIAKRAISKVYDPGKWGPAAVPGH